MTFRQWYDTGFTPLVPIIPPSADLSPFSKVKPDQRGKVPGLRKPDGTWTGMKAWIEHPTSLADCRAWAKWYDGTPSIGLRAARFPAVDIDVEDAVLAGVIWGAARALLGETPARTREGSAKMLLPYRTATPFKRMRLWFQSQGVSHLVEVLGSGNQYLVEGEHRDGSRYEWTGSLRPNDLPAINALGANAFLHHVQAVLAEQGCSGFRLEGTVREASYGERTVVQSGLEAPSVQAVRDLLDQMPNTEEHFPSRDDYLKVGYAVKAALPHDESAALEMWLDWASGWPSYVQEVAEADWSRLQPPFALGFDYLTERARSIGAPLAAVEFADICDPPPLPAPLADEGSETVAYSDSWVASLFLAKYGHLVRYCTDLGGWLVWERGRWAADKVSRVADWVSRACRMAGMHALDHAGKTGNAIALICGSNAKRVSVQSYASIDPRVTLPVIAFDADPWVLNTPDGVLDLRTGKMSPADPGRLFTRCTGVIPRRMPTPRWSRFLQETTHDDPELIAYLQRLVGYSLTGSVREHILCFLWGPGGNGKGVFLNTLFRTFGSYASVAAMDTFTASRYDRHPAELATLVGARLVTAQETQEDRNWDEAKVKSITGGDPITARFMRQDFFTYQPQFKLLFAGNHRPHVRNLDDAMRRRFHLVPFTAQPAVPDLQLADRLAQEWPGILQWAVDGCLQWQEKGLAPPQVVLDATESYFVDEDPVGRWMAERAVAPPPGAEGVPSQALFNDWRLWCLEQNERPGSERSFVSALLARGLEKWRHPRTRARGLTGIALRGGLEALPPPALEEAALLH